MFACDRTGRGGGGEITEGHKSTFRGDRHVHHLDGRDDFTQSKLHSFKNVGLFYMDYASMKL